MSGCIYFIRVGMNGPIKIGFTKSNPLHRLDELQCGCPWQLHLLGCVEGSKRQEAWLQEKFATFKMMREWFAPEIFADVSKILSSEHIWAEIDLCPIDKAIWLAGSQCALSNLTGCSQSQISEARRSGRLPKRIEAYLTQTEGAA